MAGIAAWLSALTPLARAYAVIGAVASLLLILQTIMLLIGMGQDAGVDPDTSGIGDGGPDLSPDFDLDGDGIPDIHVGLAPESLDLNANGIPDHLEHGGTFDHGLHIFTVRGLVAFFSVAGWLGVALLESNVAVWLSVLLSTLSGFLAMVFVAWVLKMVLRLQYDGTMDFQSVIGKEGTVYITIPPIGGGSGKVSLIVQEALRELDAVSTLDEPLRSGTAVKVVGLQGTTLRVAPVDRAA